MFSFKKILTFLKKKYIIYIENKKRGIHMDMNDIVARLKNGEDAQAIADEMAKSLNAAVAQVEKETKQADRKTALAQEIADRINEYAALNGYKDSALTASDVENIFAEVYGLMTGVNDLLDVLFPKSTPVKVKKVKRTDDDVIAEFLNTFINK